MKNMSLMSILGLIGLIALHGRSEGQTMNGWIEALDSDIYAERMAAVKTAESNRTAVISGLIDIVERPIVLGEPFFDSSTSRNVAIHLLGIYRADEAVPVLIGHLVMHPDHDGTRSNPLVPPPAANALVAMGSAAVPSLVEAVFTADAGALSDQCLKVLLDIEGREKARLSIADGGRSRDDTEAVRGQELIARLEKMADTWRFK